MVWQLVAGLLGGLGLGGANLQIPIASNNEIASRNRIASPNINEFQVFAPQTSTVTTLSPQTSIIANSPNARLNATLSPTITPSQTVSPTFIPFGDSSSVASGSAGAQAPQDFTDMLLKGSLLVGAGFLAYSIFVKKKK